MDGWMTFTGVFIASTGRGWGEMFLFGCPVTFWEVKSDRRSLGENKTFCNIFHKRVFKKKKKTLFWHRFLLDITTFKLILPYDRRLFELIKSVVSTKIIDQLFLKTQQFDFVIILIPIWIYTAKFCGCQNYCRLETFSFFFFLHTTPQLQLYLINLNIFMKLFYFIS